MINWELWNKYSAKPGPYGMQIYLCLCPVPSPCVPEGNAEADRLLLWNLNNGYRRE